MEMSKQNKLVIAVLLVVILFVSAVTFFIKYKKATAVPEETQRLFAGENGTLTYTDINGNEVSLEQYLGKILIATTWASWSPFTTSDLTIINQLMASYDGSKIVALAINRKEKREQAERYIATMPELNNITLVIDNADHFYKSVNGYAMPETLIFNPKGEVVEHIRGAVTKERIEAVIGSLLEQTE